MNEKEIQTPSSLLELARVSSNDPFLFETGEKSILGNDAQMEKLKGQRCVEFENIPYRMPEGIVISYQAYERYNKLVNSTLKEVCGRGKSNNFFTKSISLEMGSLEEVAAYLSAWRAVFVYEKENDAVFKRKNNLRFCVVHPSLKDEIMKMYELTDMIFKSRM